MGFPFRGLEFDVLWDQGLDAVIHYDYGEICPVFLAEAHAAPLLQFRTTRTLAHRCRSGTVHPIFLYLSAEQAPCRTGPWHALNHCSMVRSEKSLSHGILIGMKQ